MKKIIKLWCFCMILISFQMGVYSQNTTLGSGANPNNGGTNNTAIGANTLTVSTGQQNTAVGSKSLNSNLGGGTNTAVGSLSLEKNESGDGNVAVGQLSLRNNTSGSHNVSLGGQSLLSNVSGSSNVAIGFRSLLDNTLSGANVAIGNGALRYYNGPQNGGNNVSIGSQSGQRLFLGSRNIFIGQNSGPQVGGSNGDVTTNPSNGSRNYCIGEYSGASLQSGINNLLIGYEAGRQLTIGNSNTFIGRVSLVNNPSTTTTAGNDTSNTIILADGNGSQRIFVHSNGRTGIGLGNNVIPQNRLEIGTGLSNTAGLRFRGITSNSSTSPSNGKVLSVNEDGDVILVPDVVGAGGGVGNTIEGGSNINVNLSGTTYTISSSFENIYTHNGALTSDRTMDMNDFNLHFNSSNSLENGRIYIGDIPFYPTVRGDYRLYVEGGILTERVKVAMRNTANWADYVFADDYQLKPLKEVENFIKANKHLPGIESAQELVENGLDLGEMQAKQMSKIEELTLYIIEQDKKLEQQSKDIEELKALVKVLMEKK